MSSYGIALKGETELWHSNGIEKHRDAKALQ